MTDQGRFSTWMISYMTQLMEASGHTYQAFDGTFRGSSPSGFERRTRQRIGDAITMEYLVKISKKALILELKRRNMKKNDFDIQYAVSIKEDTAYLCPHFTEYHKGTRSNTPMLETKLQYMEAFCQQLKWDIDVLLKAFERRK
ncbi:hypothetical protein Tco_0769121 [Tanacetum coccineum]|uniref:Uncharacterized protein n=1 Tax=Tanacetum coccineum TaxID=301880 RepID=A0ABQ4ZBT1_9ASTR